MKYFVISCKGYELPLTIDGKCLQNLWSEVEAFIIFFIALKLN